MAGHTRASLAADFGRLGLAAGATVLVHAAMKPVGPVDAPLPDPAPDRLPDRLPGPAADPAAETVLAALRDVLGPRGTVVVPAFTESNSASSRLHRRLTAAMTAQEAARHRAAMPAFDPAHTPSEQVGRLAEAVRRAPGAHRSGHPQTSFAALGARAAAVVARHHAHDHLGEHSPLRALYDTDAAIVLLGVGYAVCSAFHLAEYRIQDPPYRDYSCVVRCDGAARWITYRDVALDDGDFPALGAAFERAAGAGTAYDADLPAPRAVGRGPVGNAESRVLPLRDAVDFAVGWLSENRPRPPRRLPGV
ncbi:AAC(3) family N-acetyltransferase [Streptomyces sp. V4-01]|uniref:Aminoglycoside N(3)-acetyltransferase n=1 Tax=Actinacidiphila polyblastidii TaxID=3110430 RepID=A0ABU7P9U6_9ACTN|nr:AAC(3) family N-acetyltransferase [Streptomyces sp. V4-01]